MNVKLLIMCLILVVPMITSAFTTLLGVIFVIAGEDLYESMMTIIISFIVFAITAFLYYLYVKRYKLKYLFLGKKYKESIKLSLKKFENADENFLKKYIALCKNNYRMTGSIESKTIYFDSYIYKNPESLKKIKNTFLKLLESVKSKNGFVEFIDNIGFDEYDSGWQVERYLTIDLVSNELQYLFCEVYKLTDFCLHDNGLSKEYTEKIEKDKKELNKVYTPILLKFEDEITKICEKL